MPISTEYFFLTRENAPCWYELSFRNDGPALMVSVHEEIFPHLPKFQNAPIVEILKKEFGFLQFEHDWGGATFGFDRAFKSTGTKDHFIGFSVPIPVLEKEITILCGHCLGNKKDLFQICTKCNGSGREKKMISCRCCSIKDTRADCLICKGKGEEPEVVMDWCPFYAISATFTLFFNLMTFGYDKKCRVNCQRPQLLSIETGIHRSMGGASVHGAYSIPLVRWLSKFPPNIHIKDTEDVLTSVWKKIHGKNFYNMDKMNTWVQIRENGCLSISCPGDRTGLFPTYREMHNRGDYGYEFSCHNVDTPMQQIVLLAALGALCDMARKAI